MFRGRGTPSNRRSGEIKAQDYRSQQQNSRSGGGQKNDADSSPRGNRYNSSSRPVKPEPPSPFAASTSTLKTVTPATNMPTKPSQPSTPQLADSNHNRSRVGNTSKENRPRSRSPVSRKEEPKDISTVGNGPSTGATKSAAVDSEVKNEDVKVVRYSGRPGEKKFSGRCRLFIANLHNVTTEEELKELFSEFGETGEVYVNREKGFGFIRLDYRHNAEIAKLTLDKKLWKGRNLQVRYATHASAIELHGLDNYASNEFIEKAMSVFGAVERAIVVCDDRGRSKGYAIVEFEWKKSAAKVLDRLKDEMFVLGRLPKPVFAKPYILTDEEEGVHEENLERLDGFEAERDVQPRFVSPNSFEYTWAKRWRDLFIDEQDKKARLEQELTDARCKLEFEMEAAIRNQEAARIREELHRRQEELRRLEEDMIRRQEADMRILERSRQRELAARQGRPELTPRDENELMNNEIQLSRENAVRQQDFNNLRQRAEMHLQQESFPNNERRGPAPLLPQLGVRPEMLGGPGFSRPNMGGPPHPGAHPALYQTPPFGGHPGALPGGARPMLPPGMMDYRTQSPRGPPPREMQQREMQQREMQHREMPQRDLPPREVPGRDVLPKEKEEKTEVPRAHPDVNQSPQSAIPPTKPAETWNIF